MAFTDPLSSVVNLPFGEIFASFLPDFVLAFAFFAALCYVVLGRRLEHPRAAIVMSGAVALALATGLVWWERERGWSIRNLGPLAVGLGVILLGMILFQAIRQAGGTWAGAGIALGASLLIGWVLGLPGPNNAGLVQVLAIVALTVGLLAFMFRHQGHFGGRPLNTIRSDPEVGSIRHDMSDLYEDRHVGDALRDRFTHLRHEAEHLHEHPQDAVLLMSRLRAMLPAEGWLTQRLAGLRAKAHLVREGHVERLRETEQLFAGLPRAAQKRASARLIAGYQKLVGIDDRLERLDQTVAANEQRIRSLSLEAQEALARADHVRLTQLLAVAQTLQEHNNQAFRHIDHLERKLSSVIDQVARDSRR